MNHPPPSRRRPGFTLIEVLLVLVILVILASLVVVSIGPIQKRANVNAAKSQIGLFKTPLQTYQMDVGTFPSSLEALRVRPGDIPNPQKWGGPYLDAAVPLDPWQNPYHYQCPGNHNPDSYDVWTMSPDGEEIGNWTSEQGR